MTAPASLTITPRNLSLAKALDPQRWWYNGDPVGTAYMNALSLTFPRGEAMFIDTVKFYRDQAPPALQAQIKAFIQQEVVHSREHLAFNRLVEEAGYNAAGIDARISERMAEAKDAPPAVRLAITVALEHYTAIMAHDFLSRPETFAGVDPQITRLWLWHAIEEVEHKGVAFDTLALATAHLSPFRRWLLRSLVMLKVTGRFWSGRLRDMGDLFAQDGIRTPRTWAKTAHFLLIHPGPLRRIFPAWLAYFKPGFHPWDHDDSHLVTRGEELIAASAG